MQNEILINATPGETRVAVLEKKQFVEFHLDRARQRGVASAVVKGRVLRVLPGMQAAFVNVGLEKAAFLYAGDYVENIEAFESGDDGPRRRRGDAPAIESLLSEGQEIVVQIAKEPIGSKGARITSHISIAGRHLVLTPWSQRVGISRRIGESRERQRLRDTVNRLRPQDLGFIIRTAGGSVREADLEADIKYLTSVWDDIQIAKDRVRAPAILYEEPSLALRVLRDFANGETRSITVDSPEVHAEMQSFAERFMAEPRPKLVLHQGPEPIFDHFGAETILNASIERKVPLPSGGSLVVDQSEALTAIDVNTGRYVGKRGLEETVLRTNLEAVREVVNQLRIRNIGGLIIIDLIDMDSAENREKVERALQEAVRRDKARTNILKISELGLVEMTRKRTRENLVQALCEPCAHCGGKGYLLSDQSMAHKVLREIRRMAQRFGGGPLAATLNHRVAAQLLGPERDGLSALEAELGFPIEVRARSDLHQEHFEMSTVGDQNDPDGRMRPALEIPWLASRASEPPPEVEAAAADESAESTAVPAPEDELDESAAAGAPAEDSTATPPAETEETAEPAEAPATDAEDADETPAPVA